MRKHPMFLAVAIAPLLFASCVMSEKPLSDEQSSKVDNKLFGTWYQIKTDGKPYAMTIGRKAGSQNVMEWFSVSLNTKQEVQVQRYDVFAKHGKTDYISIALKPKNNLIGKYNSPNPYTLELYLLNMQVLAKAVEEGELKGKVNKNDSGEYSSVALSDSPNNILNFIEKNRSKCFSKKPLIFKKLGIAESS